MKLKLYDFNDGKHILVYYGDMYVRSLLGFWHGDDHKGEFLALNILFIEFKIRL